MSLLHKPSCLCIQVTQTILSEEERGRRREGERRREEDRKEEEREEKREEKVWKDVRVSVSEGSLIPRLE